MMNMNILAVVTPPYFYQEGIVSLVTYKGGWIVYGWHKRGLINDVIILGNYIK